MESPPSPTIRLLDRILAAISSIRYGTVQIVIQDARVVQIEKTEKIRLDKAHQTPGGPVENRTFTDQTAGGKGLERNE